MTVSDPSTLKVLHVASGDLWAGAEAQLLTLATAQNAMSDVTVQVVLLNDLEAAQRFREAGITVHILDEAVLGDREIVHGLTDLLRYYRPHILHTHRSKENVLAALANFGVDRAPVVSTVHGAPEYRGGLRQWLVRLANRVVTVFVQRAVIAVSEDLARQLRRPGVRNKLRVIRNGVDTDALAKIPVVRAGDGRRHVGIVGRLQPVKRVDLFLQIAADLVEAGAGDDWIFHVYGDGPMRAGLETAAAQLLPASAIRFHGHVGDVHARIAALDCLIICSDHEGLPMTLLEALALGVPVVAHAVGGMAEVLAGDAAHRLVSDHRPPAYAAAIRDLMSAPPTPVRLPAEFTAAENARRTVALYRELR